MVTIEIKANDQRFTISGGRIVDGDMQHAPAVRELAREIKAGTPIHDIDYLIAQEFVATHGGRIRSHSQAKDMEIR